MAEPGDTPTVAAPRSAAVQPGPVAVGLDVGGSSIKAGLAGPGGYLLRGPLEVAVRGSDSREVILEDFGTALTDMLSAAAGRDLCGIGVGMPGPFDYERGVSRIRGLGKYEAIYGLDLGEALRSSLGLAPDLPIRFVNDATAFALGELKHGAGRGYSRVMVLTFGTGCGSAFAVDGRLLAGGDGVPEGGYVYRLPHRDGIVDDHLSTRGVLRLWRELAGEGEPARSVRELGERAEAGDARASTVFERFGAEVVRALGPVFAAFRPDLVILGGQIARSFRLLAPGLASEFASGRELQVRIVPAQGLATSALLGAASLVLEQP